ncbi:GGDEF domain-containing protein [Fervidobacterium islandicum]|uniref:GGDEF domain-containing protein n=1 Tax=Fervidobacterium islandicum TaxID=2423 RepID=A0AAI8GDF9_FERIS|nr:GGDEF domain-containing protein [Fervidobacterium islandicum]AMW33226.1 GGDEF domain-containing protein [Fervidobacterium islandicum]
MARKKETRELKNEINNTYLLFSQYLMDTIRDRSTPLKKRDFERLLKIAVDNLSFVHSGSVLWQDSDGRFFYLAAYNHDYDILKNVTFAPQEMVMRRFKHVYVIKRRSVDIIKELARKLNENEKHIQEKAQSIDNIKAFISIPIRSQRKIVGFFNLDTWDHENIFAETGFESVAELMGNLLSIVVERFELIDMVKEKNSELEKINLFDKLTYLPNLKFLSQYFEKYSEITKRLPTKLYLVYIDIKEFEKINRMYGHEFGDDLILKLSKIITKSCRKSDIVGRTNGDEFIILTLSKENPKSLIKRIQEKVSGFATKSGLNIEIQISTVEYGTDGKDFNTLISKAQEKIYEKRVFATY